MLSLTLTSLQMDSSKRAKCKVDASVGIVQYLYVTFEIKTNIFFEIASVEETGKCLVRATGTFFFQIYN